MSRFSFACHEAGHATACVLLGRECTFVSIELEGGYRGAAGHLHGDADVPNDRSGVCWPCFAMPWGTRAMLEQSLAIGLAGPVAERIYGADPPLGYHPPSRDEEHAREVVRRRLAMPDDVRTRIEGADADPGENDLQQNFRLAGLCSSGEELADAFLRWFELEVAAWVSSPQFRLPLFRVVTALLERGELAGAEVHELVKPPTTVKELLVDANAA